MVRPRKGLSDQDRAVWAQYAAQLRPLAGRTVEPAPAAKTNISVVQAPVTVVAPGYPIPARPGLLVIGAAPTGLDKATWQRFRSGGIRPRRLDLHGHTAQRAFDRFEQALQATAAQGIRCLEVITGRGAGEAGGVLRREFPLWLNLPHIRPLILAAAHPHAANDGSVLLLLRRGPGHKSR